MSWIQAVGKYALIGVASVMIYEGVNYLTNPPSAYEIRTIEKRQYVIDHTASPPDTVAAPKLFEAYGLVKDVEMKSGTLEKKYSAEQGWYESRR